MMNKYTMQVIKKLTFAPFFLITFTLLIFNLNTVFSSYDFIFSFSNRTLISLLTICILLTLTSLFFVLFVCFSQKLMFVLPMVSIASIIPLFITSTTLATVIIIGTLTTLLITYFVLQNALKKYLTFNPKAIFNPSIVLMGQLLLLTISLSYFLSINQTIAKNGFQIPDSLLDSVLTLTDQMVEKNTSKEPAPKLSITKEQIELLRQNPEALRQSGLDPKILDSLDQPIDPEEDFSKTLTKQLVKSQFEQTLKPYLNIIPAVLSALLFVTLMSINSLVGIVIAPILWVIFLILEKSGFVKFVSEQRPVKKMVI